MDSAKQVRKAYESTVRIERLSDGMLRLQFNSGLSKQFWGKAQHKPRPGLTDTPENYALLETKCQRMHLDVLDGIFDCTLVKYGIGKQKPQLTVITSITKPTLSTLDLYDRYCDSRKGTVEETTLEMEFKGKFRRAIVEAIDSVGDNALAIRNYLVEHRRPKTVKECLRHLSKAHQMGIRHKLVTDNPFDGMAEEIDIAKGKRRTQDNFDEEDGDEDTRSFSVDEMNAIIKSFESSGHRKHLVPIIKFLFWTGCRTGEAVGLKWRDIKWDKEIITFRRSYNKRLKLFKPTKTNTVRFFPLPKDGLLWQLLKSLPQTSLDDVVFLSKTGKIIDANKLGEIWRGKESEGLPGVIPTLIKEGKVREYLRLYATRHTFIYHQVNICKVPITTVAQWVGNSALISNNSYLDRDRYIVPGNPSAAETLPIANLSSEFVEMLTRLTPEQIEQLKLLLK